MAVITKQYSFDAAHQLPSHDGKCARPHGHTYTAEFEVRGPIKQTEGAPDQGMVMDYGHLDAVWEQLVVQLDHHDLNRMLGGEDGSCWPTTAENIALWLLRKARALDGRLSFQLYAVTVRETPKTSARVTVEDL